MEENIKPAKNNSVELSSEQQLVILKAWESNPIPPSISELVKLCWPELPIEQCDARSKNGRAIKEFIVLKKLNETITDQKPKNKELSDDFKQYIINNCSTMKPIEMARVLYNNPSLSPASAESREISAYCRTINPSILYGGEIPENDYKPPTTIDRLVARVRKYIKETESWDYRKLTPRQKKQCDALMGYLHAFRFKHQIDSYADPNSKVLFESSFLKYTYDKDDLTQEEIDQYILLCAEIVMLTNIQQTIDMLQREQDRTLEEEGKLSMSLIEAIKTAREEHNSCTKRQQSLYKALTQERSKKLSEEIKDKASLLTFFQAWKNYESRQKILKLREEQKSNLRKEIHEIENMDEMKQRVLGLSVDEIIDG